MECKPTGKASNESVAMTGRAAPFRITLRARTASSMEVVIGTLHACLRPSTNHCASAAGRPSSTTAVGISVARSAVAPSSSLPCHRRTLAHPLLARTET